MNKKTKYIWYTLAICCLLLFALILLSSIIALGERLGRIHLAVEIIFYVLIAVLVFFGIINPIRIIVGSPDLAIVTSLEQNDPKVYKVYKKVASNIANNNNLPDDSLKLLTEYQTKEELLINLQYVFAVDIKKDLNKIIINQAKVVLISTAICQSARFDMITVFTINLQMIKQLVLKCGFRPSMRNLSKLTVNVFGTALIAEGLENMRLEDVLPASSLNVLGEIPLIKPLLSSVLQGIANALLTIRIGCVTRRYLFSDGAVVTKEDIRRQALKEAAKILPLVIADTITFFPKKIIRFFSSKKKNDNEVILEE